MFDRQRARIDFLKSNLVAAKLDAIENINAGRDSALANKSKATNTEIQTWEFQIKAAKAYIANAATGTDLAVLNNIKVESETVEQIANKILTKTENMSLFTSSVLGLTRTYVKIIEGLDESTTTYDQIREIVNEYHNLVVGL